MVEYIEWAMSYAKDRGGECLSNNCPTTKSKVRLRCPVGHEWSALWGNLKYKGHWCKKCIGLSQRKTIDDAIILAKNRNGECLSSDYSKNSIKLKWRCEKGHVFMASYNKVSQGRWCPYCSKKVKHTIDVAKAIAVERDGECLSTEYSNTQTNLKWKCNKGHIWEATLNNVKNHNKWCLVCYRNRQSKYTIDDVIELAIDSGGTCLSKTYVNYGSKLEFECSSGHRWHASFASVKSGNTWCPHCRLKSQNRLFDIISGIFGGMTVHSNYKKFKWLKNAHNNGRQELDIYVEDIKLAIEYDGQGHFFPVNFGGCSDLEAKRLFQLTLSRDKLKNEKVRGNSEDVKYFIRFNYKDKLSKENVIKKLALESVPVDGV